MLQALSRIVFVLIIGMTALAALPAEGKGGPAPPPRKNKIRVLIVTGGHNFERDAFFALFKGHPDITYREVVQPDAQAWFSPEKASEYDVLVWYDMYQDIFERARKDLAALLNKGKPLVALHHCLAGYQNWPEARKIIGGKYYIKPQDGNRKSTYRHDVKFKVTIADPRHPITRFMKNFEIHDEVYNHFEVLSGVKPLLTTDHPESGKVIGWTHTYGKSPVVYIELGHGPEAYGNPHYRRLVVQAIRWAAGQLPDPSEAGFVSLFNGKNLAGWHVMGEPGGFEVANGVIRSESGDHGFWLRSDRTYSDFILRIEWRICKKGNSGVFVRSRKTSAPWNPGSEIQISHEHRDDLHCTGALYGRVSVEPRPDESPEVWHEFEIHCRGPRIKVFADQIPVVDVDQRDVPAMKDFPLSGYIGMQDSHTAAGWVEYRNVRIKELKPTRN